MPGDRLRRVLAALAAGGRGWVSGGGGGGGGGGLGRGGGHPGGVVGGHRWGEPSDRGRAVHLRRGPLRRCLRAGPGGGGAGPGRAGGPPVAWLHPAGAGGG